MPLLIPALVIVPCFLLLAWSADRFVYGAGGLARHLGMSPLLVGLLIVGFGTSAPELLISAIAAAADNTALAVGNALGSNVANIALIMGLTAVLIPLTLTFRDTRRELIALLAATALTPLLLLDGRLHRIDGWLLLAALLIVVGWLARASIREYRGTEGNEIDPELIDELPPALAVPTALGWIAIGLTLLLVSARILVWAAVELATAAGVSELVIGLTIVAAGTSLPELATAIAAARRRHFGMVLGNVVGSNLFNLLGVLGVAAVIRPAAILPEVLYRDYVFMASLTLLLGWLTWKHGRAGRLWGVGLLLAYAGYQLLLFAPATPG